MSDTFAVTLCFKNSDDNFVEVTQALGEIGQHIEPGIRIAYWSNPGQDRPGVETHEAQVMVRAAPDVTNEDAYTLKVNSVSRLAVDNSVAVQGDVKIEYEII